MFCPFCESEETKVVDSRLVEDGSKVRRRRECLLCKQRYTTYEVSDLEMPRIVKRDGRRSSFKADNLRNGMLKALEKRPVSMSDIDAAVQRITHAIQVCGEREIPSEVIGKYVMKELRCMDQVAYVRFASIYKSFEDVSEFHQEIETLQQLREYE